MNSFIFFHLHSHKAKNMLPPSNKGGRHVRVRSCICGETCVGKCNNPENIKGATKTGIAIWHLQNSVPNAAVLYASATSFSEVRNMAPMTRLCLWGPSTPFRNFGDFETGNNCFFALLHSFSLQTGLLTVTAMNPREKRNHPGQIPMMEILVLTATFL